MPGTAVATLPKVSGVMRVLANRKSDPAAPSACFVVLPSSLASWPTNSELALRGRHPWASADPGTADAPIIRIRMPQQIASVHRLSSSASPQHWP